MKVFLITLSIFCSSVCYSQSIKMKVTGLTQPAGEEIIAFEMSDTLPYTSSYGGGGSVSAAKFEVVKIKKLRDSSTNELWRRSIMAVRTPDFTFEFYNASQVLTYKISLKDVIILHFSFLTPECTNCLKLYHQAWLDFAKIEVYDMVTGTSVKYNRQANVVYQ